MARNVAEHCIRPKYQITS